MTKEKHDILTYNAIIWTDWQKTGFVQKELDGWGIYSLDTYTTKIDLGFDYTNMKYLEQSGEFEVDSMPMTLAQKQMCLAYLDSKVVPLSWYKKVIQNSINNYFAKTAWAIERYNDPTSSKAIPEDIIKGRTIARQLIDKLDEVQNEDNIATPELLEKLEEIRVLYKETLGACDSCGNSKV